MELSIVVPAYNEEARLPTTLKTITTYLKEKSISFEVIVIDDGSTDRMRPLIKAMAQTQPEIRLLVHPQKQGKGYAVRSGVLAAKGDLVLFTDSDLSTPITELPKLLTAVQKEGFDIAIASRAAPGARIMVRQPWYRGIIGQFCPILVRRLVLSEFYDTQCGFKLFRREVAVKLFHPLQTKGFAFDVEILKRARLLGFSVKEVPVVWFNSPASKVSLWRDPFRMFRDIIFIKFRGGA